MKPGRLILLGLLALPLAGCSTIGGWFSSSSNEVEPEPFAIVAGHPDYDESSFAALDLEEVFPPGIQALFFSACLSSAPC